MAKASILHLIDRLQFPWLTASGKADLLLIIFKLVKRANRPSLQLEVRKGDVEAGEGDLGERE